MALNEAGKMQWLLIALLLIARQGLGSPAVDTNALSPLSTGNASKSDHHHNKEKK